MVQFEASTIKFEDSLGIILPKAIIKKAGIKENESVRVLVIKQNQTGERLFAALKGKFTHSTQEIKDMLREELYNY